MHLERCQVLVINEIEDAYADVTNSFQHLLLA